MKLINLVCRSRDEILYITSWLHNHREPICNPALGLTGVQFWLTFLNLSVVMLLVWQWYASDWPFWTSLLSCSRSDRGTVLTENSELLCCHALGLAGLVWLTILNFSVTLLSVWQWYSSDWPFWTYLLPCSRSLLCCSRVLTDHSVLSKDFVVQTVAVCALKLL